MSSPRWHDWGARALDLAARQDQPVLVCLIASWCPHSRRLLAGPLHDPGTRRLLGSQFVPVLVDVDRQPEVAMELGAGVTPIVLILDGTGNERRRIVGQDLERLGALLQEFISDGRRGRGSGAFERQVAESTASALFDAEDAEAGGFGHREKYPHAAALRFALLQGARTRDDRLVGLACTALDAMAGGALHDTVEGGFFRSAQHRDWSRPCTEKPLATNAVLAGVLAEAHGVTGRALYRDAAERTLVFMEQVLLDSGTGAYRAGIDADDDYYAGSLRDRASAGHPAVTPTVPAAANAQVVQALLGAARCFDRSALVERACRVTDGVLERLYDPGHEVYHFWDGSFQVGGLAADKTAWLAALVELAQAPGRSDYLEVALDIASLLEGRHVAADGAWKDLAGPSPGTRSDRLRMTGEAAEALVRLSVLTGEERWRRAAKRGMEAFRADYRAFGLAAAPYASAAAVVADPPLAAVVRGASWSGLADVLHSAAWSGMGTDRVVVRDVSEASGGGTVELRTDGASLGRVDDPRQVSSALAAAGRAAYPAASR